MEPVPWLRLVLLAVDVRGPVLVSIRWHYYDSKLGMGEDGATVVQHYTQYQYQFKG